MKMIEILFESENKEIIKASRMMKFSLKNGENSFGVDLAKANYEYYITNNSNFVYIGKPNALKIGTTYRFENAEKPGFAAERNLKLTAAGDTVKTVMKTFDEAFAFIKGRKIERIIIDPDLLKGAVKPAEKPKAEDATEPENGYFALGCWLNAYSRNSDKEYFWSGPFEDRKSALAYGKRKQDKGQPSTFRDWSKGTTQIIKGVDKFVTAAKKVGMNPNVKDLYWHE